MINAILRIPVSKDNQRKVIQLLRSLIEPTRVERGCISCRLYREIDEDDALTWLEEWDTPEDLRRHLRSPMYKRILTALDMSDAQPEVRFDTVAETRGMQLIEEARGVGF